MPRRFDENEPEERFLRGTRPNVLTETREVTRNLDQSRSTAKKRQALKDFRGQILRDERIADHSLPHYVAITEASPYLLPRTRLRKGWNILGVQTAGAFTIRLPMNTHEDSIITIKDERGDASSNPITIETYAA